MYLLCSLDNITGAGVFSNGIWAWETFISMDAVAAVHISSMRPMAMAFTLSVNKTMSKHCYLLAAHHAHLPLYQKHSLWVSGSVNTNKNVNFKNLLARDQSFSLQGTAWMLSRGIRTN